MLLNKNREASFQKGLRKMLTRNEEAFFEKFLDAKEGPGLRPAPRMLAES
jgi:hypothetical protein